MEQPKVVLSEADKAYLKSYVSKGNHSARAIRRARMLLQLEQGGKQQQQIARDCNCSEGTVTNLLKRYSECKGVIKEVLEEKAPQRAAHYHYPGVGSPHYRACLLRGRTGRTQFVWTLDLIADKMVSDGHAVHLSYETVRKVLKKANSGPG